MKKSENKNKLRERFSHFELDFNLKSSFIYMFQAGILTSLRQLLLPIPPRRISGFIEDRLIRVTAADTVPDSNRIPYCLL